MDKNLISMILNCDIEPPLAQDYEVLLSWFKTSEELISWAGRSIGKSMQREEVLSNVRQAGYASYALKNKKKSLELADNLMGFGQYQKVNDVVHLARLVINPKFRHRGLLKLLIYKLVQQAELEGQVRTLSLFVFIKNLPAVLAYKRFGFKNVEPPAGITLPEECEYMVLNNKTFKHYLNQVGITEQPFS